MGLRSDSLSVRSGSDLTLQGSGNLTLKGASVLVNPGGNCAPAARTTDQVLVPVGAENQTVIGSILVGSPDVCIG